MKSTGKLWGNPMSTCVTLTLSYQEHVHLATVTSKTLGGTDKRAVTFGGERKWYWMAMNEGQHQAPKDYSPAAEEE